MPENDLLLPIKATINEIDCNDRRMLNEYVNSTKPWNVYIYTFALALGNASDAVEIFCVGYVMANYEGMSNKDKEFLSSAVFLGMLFGGLIGGTVSDKFGRKVCLLISLAISTISGFGSAIAPNINCLIAIKLFGGLGIGASVPAVFTLGSEIFPQKQTGEQLSVIASFWMVGSIFVGLVAWILLGEDFNGQRFYPHATWRLFSAVCALPALLSFIVSWIVLPESPKYLVFIANNVPKAMTTLATMTGLEIADGVICKDCVSPSLPPGPVFHHNYTCFRNIFEAPLWTTTCSLGLIWFSLCFGTYGISTWITVLFTEIGMDNPIMCSVLFSLATLPANLFSIYFMESVGRRKLLLTGLVVSTVAALGFSVSGSKPCPVLFFAVIFNCFGGLSWNALDCLSVESFPTCCRTSAMGILTASGRIGAVAAQVVNGRLQNSVPLLLLVTSSFMVLGGACAWFYPGGEEWVPSETSDCEKTCDGTVITTTTTS